MFAELFVLRLYLVFFCAMWTASSKQSADRMHNIVLKYVYFVL